MPYFTDESVAKEQGIIAQEIGMIEDDPEWQVYKRMLQALYRQQSRPYPRGRLRGEHLPHHRRDPVPTATRPSTPPPICVWWRWVIWTPRRCSGQRRISCPRKAARISPVTTVAARETPPLSRETSCRMEVSMPSFLVGFKCPAPPEGEQRLRWDILGDLAWRYPHGGLQSPVLPAV